MALWGHIRDLERNHIAAAQLTVDGQVEHCQVTVAPLNLQLGPDQPDVFCLQRRLGASQFSFVPGCAVGIAIVVSYCIGGLLLLIEDHQHAKTDRTD